MYADFEGVEISFEDDNVVVNANDEREEELKRPTDLRQRRVKKLEEGQTVHEIHEEVKEVEGPVFTLVDDIGGEETEHHVPAVLFKEINQSEE